MKVKVEFTVEVDVDGWMMTYGQETPAEVRADVKDWVKNAAYGGQSEGLISPA